MADAVVRFRSCLNPWMDCVVFVPEAYQLSAIEAIRSAVEEFIKDGGVCYSDYIHSCLKEASIPYTMVISDYDVETDEPPDQWYEWVAACNVVAEVCP